MRSHIDLASQAVDYAAVPIIDFAKAGTPEGRAELTPQVRDAMRTHGFMCIVNHGLAQGQISHQTVTLNSIFECGAAAHLYMRRQNDRMVDIADVPFSAVPDDEQARFLSNVRVKPGDWRGYKPRQFWVRRYHYSPGRTRMDRQHSPGT